MGQTKRHPIGSRGRAIQLVEEKHQKTPIFGKGATSPVSNITVELTGGKRTD